MVFHIGGTTPQDTTKADLQKKDNLEAQYAREERLRKAEKEKTDVDIQKALTGSKPNSDENIARMIKNLNEIQAKSDYLQALDDQAKAEAEARAEAEAEAKAKAEAEVKAQKLEAKKQEILNNFKGGSLLFLELDLRAIGLSEEEVDKASSEYVAKNGVPQMYKRNGVNQLHK